ncbi:MAG TPA: hypothetical protein VGB73_16380 [Pyrinomonadaceae bacterium]
MLPQLALGDGRFLAPAEAFSGQRKRSKRFDPERQVTGSLFSRSRTKEILLAGLGS